MREELHTHTVNKKDERLHIEPLGEVGKGGANQHYLISGFHTYTNQAVNQPGSLLADETSVNIIFQNGIPEDVGTNGITMESLLAIVADRLAGFQSGPYPCMENEKALHHTEEALRWLHQRTLKQTQGRVADKP